MKTILATTLLLSLTATALASNTSITIPMRLVSANGKGPLIGYVTAKNSRYGLILTPHLHGLTPGEHGFHIHTKPNCKQFGMAAGGHFDPQKTGKHLGPYNPKGHLGDLPVLMVNKKGNAVTPILAPRLTVAKIKDHSLMIHQGGDNYSDKPLPLGGGGKRVACGVIQ